MTVSIRVGGEAVAIISGDNKLSVEKRVAARIEYYRERYAGERVTTKVLGFKGEETAA